MLRKRLISKLLVENGQLVKYRQFTRDRRVVGNPVATARTLTDQVVDEFFVCDMGTISPELVHEMVINTMTPVTAAGGIHSYQHAADLIRHGGADKIVTKDLRVAEKVAGAFGRQSVVWPYDYREVFAPFVPDCAGEVVLTSILNDGMYCGLDLDALKREWEVPVVIAGGVGKLFHVKQGFDVGADGVCISSMWAFTDKSPVKVRSWLVSEGCNVRAA